MKIEKFKVVNAPEMAKLLSLADLGGLADLAEGEGISFDILEINMEKKKIFNIKRNFSFRTKYFVLMEGYQNQSVTIKGTLVPAKTLNKMISKIPLMEILLFQKKWEKDYLVCLRKVHPVN